MSSDVCGLPIELEELKTDPKMLNPVNKNMKSGSLFNSKMSLERKLSILVFIVTVVLLILLVFTLYSTEATRRIIIAQMKNGADLTCVTVTCLQAAVEIKNSLNTSVNPCEDFHEFVCGKWQSQQVLTKNSSRYSVFEVLHSKLNEDQRKLLEGSKFKSISPVYSKATRLYKSCLNLDKLNDLDSKPLENYINTLFGKYGGWEMQSDDVNSSLSNWDFLKVIEDPLVENTVFKITVEEEEIYSSRYIFKVYLPNLWQKENILRNSEKPENRKMINHFMEYMYEICKLLKLKKNKFDEIDEILKLEINISKKFPTKEELKIHGNTDNKMKVKELQNKYCPEFNWTEIFRRRMEMARMQMNEDMDVVVTRPAHLREICKLFKSDAKTKRTIHNYVIWTSIFQRIDYLSENFLRAKKKFDKTYNGKVDKSERWEHCLSVVQNNMGLVLDSMYVQSNVPKETNSQVKEMIILIQAKLHNFILNNTWIYEKAKSELIKKINTISSVIGYSDNLLNTTYVKKEFDDVEISEENYFQNMIKLINRATIKSLRKLLQRHGIPTLSHIPQVNAFYDDIGNQIMFHSGILQSPFYEPGFPRPLKYGGIGSVIGHEITHAFSYILKNIIFGGNISSELRKETLRIIHTKLNCLINQYSNYSIHGRNLNGLMNIAENIADNGGIRLTYQVYKDLQNKHGIETRLPGLSFTEDQLFFISAGRLWCNVQTKESAIKDVLTEPHTPRRYRVIGTLSNFKEFSEAFNCPLGSPMNPTGKCTVW